jgi:transposase
MKQSRISTDLIKKSTYFIPFYINEAEWDRVNLNTWFDCIHYDYQIDHTNQHDNRCSIDIGCMNFISLYGVNGECYKIKSDYKKIDKILKTDKYNNKTKDRLVMNLINELHTKAAKFICSKYDVIYIGYVNNSGKIDSNRMHSIYDNLLKILHHNDFLVKLEKISKKYKKELKIVDESFTSVTCTSCGELNKFKRIWLEDDSDRRKYTCEYCNIVTCRDIAASRNILIKNE